MAFQLPPLVTGRIRQRKWLEEHGHELIREVYSLRNKFGFTVGFSFVRVLMEARSNLVLSVRTRYKVCEMLCKVYEMGQVFFRFRGFIQRPEIEFDEESNRVSVSAGANTRTLREIYPEFDEFINVGLPQYSLLEAIFIEKELVRLDFQAALNLLYVRGIWKQ